MPRSSRLLIDGLAYHLLNRGNRKQQIFTQPADYEEFLGTLADATERHPIGLIGFSVMPNHFHLVVWPKRACEIPAFMCWFMNAHIRRHHRWHELCGTGHLYQGRYKAFPIQQDGHLLTVLRYVESNASRAKLVDRAENWPWSSLAVRFSPDDRSLLVPSPVRRPDNWLALVNQKLPEKTLSDVRVAAQRQVPFGDSQWIRDQKNKRGHSFTSVPLECPP